MHKWSDEEIEILKAGYCEPILNLSALALKLKTSKSNTCTYARKFNLTKRTGRARKQFDTDFLLKHFSEYSDKEFSEKMNKSIYQIRWQCKKLNLRRDNKFIKKQISEGKKKSWQNPRSKYNGPKFRQFLSDRMTKMQARGELNKGNLQYKSGKRTDLGIYVRSAWEANYARYLNWVKSRGGIREWYYEKDTFSFPIKRGTRSYTPDFKVIENDGSIVYHEVKGWMTQKGKTRLKRMKIYYPNIKLVLIAGKEYLAISKWRALIPGWES